MYKDAESMHAKVSARPLQPLNNSSNCTQVVSLMRWLAYELRPVTRETMNMYEDHCILSWKSQQFGSKCVIVLYVVALSRGAHF